MNVTVNLSEEDIKRAILDYVQKHYPERATPRNETDPTGNVYLRHYQGSFSNPTDNSYFEADVELKVGVDNDDPTLSEDLELLQ